MARKTDVSWRIITATLDLVADQPWRRIGLSDIAAASGVSLIELHKHFSSKNAILRGFMARIDAQVLSALDKDPDPDVELDGPRDRLFDVIMRRFDALNPHKNALRGLARTVPADPAGLLCNVPAFMNSMGWMLEAAGVNASGLRGAVRTRGLAAIYLMTARVWFNDDSDDMSVTMATLDKGLGRAEGIMNICRRGFGASSRWRCAPDAPAGEAEATSG